MRITTLNLWGYVHWQERQDVIVDYLKEVQPDVIAFQEVVYLPKQFPVSQVHQLAEQLDYPYRYESITRLQVGKDGAPYREGLALLSRVPASSVEALSLIQDPRDEHQRILQLADFTTDEGTIKLANAHYSITDTFDFATPQLNETIALFNARGEQRIITGDFNIRGLSTENASWSTDYTLVNDGNYVSFPETNDCIDYFLAPHAYTATDLLISPDGLSDHRAITVDFTLK